MVHPLNQLKDIKAVRSELTKAKRAAGQSPITRAEVAEIVAIALGVAVEATEERFARIEEYIDLPSEDDLGEDDDLGEVGPAPVTGFESIDQDDERAEAG